MGALRVLTPEKIREFHKEMYQPKNLCIVIVGQIVHEELLEILCQFENSIKDDIPNQISQWRRFEISTFTRATGFS